MTDEPDAICAHIRATRGLPAKIALACGIRRQAIYQWTRVPVERVRVVAKILKLPAKKIRPDIFQ
jgi:hypothetical protein